MQLTSVLLLQAALGTPLPQEASIEPDPQAARLIDGSNGEFFSFIEGAGIDAEGNSYFTSFASDVDPTNADLSLPRIGKVANNGEISLFFEEPTPGTQFNAIKFTPDGRCFAGDVGNKRVLEIMVDPETGLGTESRVACEDASIVQANDLTVRSDGIIYFSGQDFGASTGELQMCSPDGTVTSLLSDVEIANLNRTNGIELSADESTLFFTSAATVENFQTDFAKLFSLPLNADGTAAADSPTLFFDFADDGTATVDPDGIRFDTAGDLYVTRNGGSEVVVINSQGVITRRIATNTIFPTNIGFGGPNGTTLRISGRCGEVFGEGPGCVDVFENEVQGLRFAQLNELNDDDDETEDEGEEEDEADDE